MQIHQYVAYSNKTERLVHLFTMRMCDVVKGFIR